MSYIPAYPQCFTRQPDGSLVEAIPLPFSWGLFPWVWLRLTGYRDEYGRKAQLLKPWES